MNNFIEQLKDSTSFCFTAKEDFIPFDEEFKNSGESLKNSLISVALKTLEGKDRAFSSCDYSKIWTALNCIELCVYYRFDFLEIKELFLFAVDLMHKAECAPNPAELCVTIHFFRMVRTFYSIVAQCYGMGDFRKWFFSEKESSSPPSLVNAFFSDVINTTRASIYCYAASFEKKQCPFYIKKIPKVLAFCDHLYGDGADAFFKKNNIDAAVKKTKLLRDVNLHNISDYLLGYYSCKTNNEKTRYIANFKNWYDNYSFAELIAVLDSFLRSQLKMHP